MYLSKIQKAGRIYRPVRTITSSGEDSDICRIGVRRGLYSGGWSGCIANPLHSCYLTRGLRRSHGPRSC